MQFLIIVILSFISSTNQFQFSQYLHDGVQNPEKPLLVFVGTLFGLCGSVSEKLTDCLSTSGFQNCIFFQSLKHLNDVSYLKNKLLSSGWLELGQGKILWIFSKWVEADEVTTSNFLITLNISLGHSEHIAFMCFTLWMT